MAIYRYGRLQTLAEGVHVLDGAWKRSPLGRRMTVIEGGDGELALHSAIELEDADIGIIDGLGKVAIVLVPNRFHSSDASFWADRYPEAKVLVPRQIEAEMAGKLSRVDGVIEDGLPWGGADFVAYPLAGTKMGEVLFYHRPSRTLITTDIVFHFQREDFRGIAKLFMKLNGALGNFGPTRLAKRFFIRDKSAFADSMRPVLALDIDHVIMSHGRVLERDGAQRLRDAFVDL
jgi:hypothetical protein